MVDFLKEYIQNIGIELNQDKINKLINYYELLIEKNKVMNQIGRASCRERV